MPSKTPIPQEREQTASPGVSISFAYGWFGGESGDQ